MLIGKLIWLYIVSIIFICVFNTTAVYPVPGSYYSVLLRYNNRGKNRKGARVGPSPIRLWAYFDPPSVLGSLALGSIDNNLEVHNRKRSVWASQGTVKNTKEEGLPPARDAESVLDQIKSVEISQFSSGAERVEIRNTESISDQKDNRKLEDTEDATIDVASSCGGNEMVILDPYNYVPDSEGRFFYKIIQTVGYPYLYEPQSKCIWNFQIGRECQMGMIIVEFLKGTLIQSSQCQLDSINILFNGESKNKVCGSTAGAITSLKWTKTGKQLVQVALETKSEETTFAPGHEWGAKISLSGYCWVYAPHFLTQSLAGIKEKEGLKKDHVKVSEDGNKNSQNKGESHIPTTHKGNITTSATLKPNSGSNIKMTTENELLTTVGAMDIKSITERTYETTTTDEISDLKSESVTISPKSESATTDETLVLKSEPATTDETLVLKSEPATTDETLGLKSELATIDEISELKSESATIEPFMHSDSELMTTLIPSRTEIENEMVTIDNAI